MKPDTEKIFILTDLCMWEKNKQEGTNDAHSIIVVDEETGQTRLLGGGTKIRFVEGLISEPMTQEEYNAQPPQLLEEVTPNTPQV